jgi:hypothetical protein
MDARPVDPRDVRSEETSPEYRVTFWERTRAPAETPISQIGFRADEWSVGGAASVLEVLAWADLHAGPGRSYTVGVITPERCLLRLAGTDPTDPESWTARPGTPPTER